MNQLTGRSAALILDDSVAIAVAAAATSTSARRTRVCALRAAVHLVLTIHGISLLDFAVASVVSTFFLGHDPFLLNNIHHE
jgi:hypothetical protein